MKEGFDQQPSIETKQIVERIYEEASSLEGRSRKMDYIALAYYESKLKNSAEMIELIKKDFSLSDDVEAVLRGKYPELPESGLEALVAHKIEELIQIYETQGLYDFVASLETKNSRDREMAGLFYFFINPNKEGEIVCNIHFDKDAVTTEDKNVFSFSASMEVLLGKIVERKTLPAYIRAESWLMGVRLLQERMGFEVKKVFDFGEKNDKDMLDTTPATWGQFLDEEGKVKKEELMYLFIKGEPRYKKTVAILSIDEAFKRYGEKYKGETLHFLDTSRADEAIKRRSQVQQEIKDRFDDLSYEEVLQLLYQIPTFKEALSSEVGEKVKTALKDAKLRKLSFDEFLSENKNLLQEYDELMRHKFDEYTDSLNEEFIYQL